MNRARRPYEQAAPTGPLPTADRSRSPPRPRAKSSTAAAMSARLPMRPAGTEMYAVGLLRHVVVTLDRRKARRDRVDGVGRRVSSLGSWSGRPKRAKTDGDRKAVTSATRSPSSVSTSSAIGTYVRRVLSRRRRPVPAGRSPVWPRSGPRRRAARHQPRARQGVPARGHAGIGRHAEGRVLGEHGQDRVDLTALEGVGEALDDRADAPVAQRQQRGLLASLGHAFLDGLAGTLERAVHGGDGRVERLRCLLRGEPEHVAQDQRGALPRGQVLERRDEGQLERLTALVALGRGGAVRHA